VIWTQLERPKSARVNVQDEIAQEVTVALRNSVR
jgi:hypothetical protein